MLVVAPASYDCADLERAIFRLLRAVPPFDEIDAEKLHRDAYPDPAQRPPLHLPDTWGMTAADVMFDA